MKINEPIDEVLAPRASKYREIWLAALEAAPRWIPIDCTDRREAVGIQDAARSREIHQQQYDVKVRGLTAYVRAARRTA